MGKWRENEGKWQETGLELGGRIVGEQECKRELRGVKEG